MKEREALQKRLEQIDAALGSGALLATPTRAAAAPAPTAAPARRATPAPSASAASKRRGRPPRSGNGLSIREAITRVTSKQALGLTDLVNAVQAIGYKFESKNPRNSVGAYLYSPYGKKHFRRVNGKFSPAK